MAVTRSHALKPKLLPPSGYPSVHT